MREIWMDENGRTELYLPEQWGVFVPPQVEIVDDVFLRFSPWPSHEDLEEMPASQIGSVYSRWIIPWLLAHGWKKQGKTGNLLSDLMGLPELTPETVGKYVKFARKYGPLWQEGIFGKGRQLLSAWDRVRQEVVAAFNAIVALREGKKVRAQDWVTLFPEYNDNGNVPPAVQKQALAGFITEKLEEVSFWLTWYSSPEVTINTGLGFLNVAWLQLAQALTGKLTLCICDGCGKAYVRLGRVPQKGRKNYCDECGERGAKRAWWKENRAGEFTKTKTKTGE